jgi:hypothetical protein
MRGRATDLFVDKVLIPILMFVIVPVLLCLVLILILVLSDWFVFEFLEVLNVLSAD